MFVVTIIIGFALLMTSHESVWGLQLPPNIKKCKSFDSACIKESGQKLIPLLAKGLPEYGISSWEPIVIPDIKNYQQGTLIFKFTDIKAYGITTSKIHDFKIDPTKKIIKFSMSHDARVEANYGMTGNLFLIPVDSSGKAFYQIDNIQYSYVLYYDTVKGDDQKYHWKIVKHKTSYKPKKVQYKFTNLFQGNKLLGQVVTDFANENWKSIFEDLAGPFMEPILAKTVDAIQSIFSNVPLENMILSD